MKKIFLLDTNIISESFYRTPDSKVINKIDENENHSAISSITWNELLYGALIMPESKRKDWLYSRLIDEVQKTFPILNFDSHCAWILGDLRSRLKKSGMAVDYADLQIASIAISNQMILVTRNTKHFGLIQNVSGNLVVENWFE
ncbi:PIN domain-containing protein [Treponema sp.]|uniref:PIN domain-containing protein n=1 Tax=Treponema sp. TaxID=166 RepID=UPI00298DB29C|nr:PIN domain-containing protein [Treponema sp.]MCQ2242185.1 PIN domain-containing protein [Treponema sp.]